MNLIQFIDLLNEGFYGIANDWIEDYLECNTATVMASPVKPLVAVRSILWLMKNNYADLTFSPSMRTIHAQLHDRDKLQRDGWYNVSPSIHFKGDGSVDIIYNDRMFAKFGLPPEGVI